MNVIEENRVGSFIVTDALMKASTNQELAKIFSGMIIVRAEFRYDSFSIKYIAYSKHFKKVAQGILHTEYKMRWDDDNKRLIEEI